MYALIRRMIAERKLFIYGSCVVVRRSSFEGEKNEILGNVWVAKRISPGVQTSSVFDTLGMIPMAGRVLSH